MACCTFASAQANNHSKTTLSLTTQRNYATTTTPFARVSTLVKKDDFAPRSIVDEGIEMFEVSKRFPYTPRRFQWKTVALANRQEPQPFHHAPRTRHRNFQTKSSKKANHSRRLASKQASIRVDSARANLLGLVCHGQQQQEGLCTLSVAKVQNGVSHEAHVAPNSVQRRKCVRTALHIALGSTRLNALDSERVQTPDEGPSRTSVSKAQV